MEVAVDKKQPTDVDSDTLLAAAEEVTSSRTKAVEVEVRANSQLFAAIYAN